MTSRISQRMLMREDVRAMFHQYWQGFTALKTYATILERSPLIMGQERVAVEELVRLIRKLEEQTDAIRSRVIQLVG